MPFPPSESSSPRKYSSSGKENCTADFCNADRNNAVKLITPCATIPLWSIFSDDSSLFGQIVWVKHSKHAENTLLFFLLFGIYLFTFFRFFFLSMLSKFLRLNSLNGDFVAKEEIQLKRNVFLYNVLMKSI